MGLFSKKEEESKIDTSKIINVSTLDYVPGYKVVESYGIVAAYMYRQERTLYVPIKALKEDAASSYPDCNAIIGLIAATAYSHDGAFGFVYTVYTGTAVRIEPES